MKTSCKDIRDLLAAEGPELVRDDVASHVADCSDCAAFLESLRALESDLGALPSHDAPDDVVGRLLARPELLESVDDADSAYTTGDGWAARLRALFSEALRPRPMVWSGAAAAMLIVVATVVLWPEAPVPELVVASKNAPATVEVADVEEPLVEGRLAQLEREMQSTRERVAARTDDFSDAPAEHKAKKPQAKTSPPPPVVGDELAQRSAEPLPDSEAFADDYRFQAAPTQPTQSAELQGGRDKKAGSKDEDFAASVSGVSSADVVQPTAYDEEVAIEQEAQEALRAEDARFAVEKRGREEWQRRQNEVGDRNEAAKIGVDGPLIAGVGGVVAPQVLEAHRVRPEYPEGAEGARIPAKVVLSVYVAADGTVLQATVLKCDAPDLGFEAAALEAVRQWRYEPARDASGNAVAVMITETIEFDPDEPEDDEQGRIDVAPDTTLAQAFLKNRAETVGLRFRPASGYWANTYLPGDPRMRWLASRLAAAGTLPAGLHDAARPPAQPFDAPSDAAIDVFLHADRTSLDGPGRALVQVGLQGTTRHGGRRPAMNVAIVLDLRGGVSADTAVAMRSLVRAFQSARDTGDRFRLLATTDDGVLVSPDSFRHGVLEVTLDRLFGAKKRSRGRNGLSRAVATAFTDLAADDDPTSPLGATAVILVTGQPFGAATRPLIGLAHQGAVAGIPMTVVGIGGGVDLDEIDRVALAGQGNRRLLDRPAEATALVGRELAAVGRAVARAVRLKIRLAPGVKLVDVVGSHRLDEAAADRVREAERSIDLRLASRLGIEADRGDDEDGIQVVIPTFYAGDAHVVLLDVVAPGPGPIAEATVRFKDLAQLKNGTVRASLALGEDAAPAGPLERNVLKNLLSHELAGAMEAAAEAVRAGDGARAARLLDDQAALLAGVGCIVPGFGNDPDLARDLAMLDTYRSVLRTGAGLASLSDSLLVAAHRKLQPRSLEIPS